MTIEEPDFIKYAKFGRHVAAVLGSSTEWNGGDVLQELGDISSDMLGVPVGDQDPDTLAMWRAVADQIGVEYDEDADDEEDALEEEDDDTPEDGVEEE